MSGRIVAVSPDKGLCEELARTLEQTGVPVDTYRTLATLGPDELSATLCVIHFTDLLTSTGGLSYLDRVPPGTRVIALLPRSNLATLVEIMRASDRVFGMFVADSLDHASLLAMARRVLDRDVFGVDKVLAGAELHTFTCKYAERKLALARVNKLLVKHGISRSQQIHIEQCLDEMLMNALYDAPVDADGNPIFISVPARTRVTLRLNTSVTVQYAFDGQRVAIGVRDVFGTLTRQTVLRVLYKCLHAEDKIDRKAGGAGVGLYLMVNASTAVYFNVIPGVATEAICCFGVRPAHGALENFAFTELAEDPSGAIVRTSLSAADLQPAPMRGPLRAWMALPLLALLAIGIAVVLNQPAAPKPPEPPPPVIELDSQPTNARVEIDAAPVGHTPLELTTYPPGTRVTATLRSIGYRDAQVELTVPPRGQRVQHVETLVASDEFVTVRVTSEPPGAQVIVKGQEAGASRTYTPAELTLATGVPHEIQLVMPGHATYTIPAFSLERGQQDVEKTARLVPLD